MINRTTLSFVILLSTCSFLNSQNISISNVPVGKLQNFDYIGTGSKHHYFSSVDNQVHRFDKQNLSSFTTIPYKLDDKREYTSEKHIIDDRLVVISKISDPDKGPITSMINVYQFDPVTGTKLKVIKTGGIVEKSIYYSSTLDTVKKQIVITINDSIVTLLDYDLQAVSFDKDVKYKKPDFDFEFLMFDLEQLLANLNIRGFSFSLSGGSQSHTDSTSVKNFIISYEKKTNKDIPYFERSIDKVNILTRNKDSKVKDIDFSLTSDKSIIDLYLREDLRGNLLIIGKYNAGSASYAQYGMFSAKYDQKLNEMSPLKYYDLVSANIEPKIVPNKKFMGLFYTKMAAPKHKFILEDDAMIFVYQASFDNVKDHIYIVKVESSGELLVNMIANQVMVNKKNPYGTQTFVPVLLREKLVFIFYENPLNLDQSSNEVRVAHCDATKKTSVLVSCSYDIDSDDVRKKKVIAQNASFKTLPNLNEFSIYYDAETGNWFCLVPGETKKNVTKVLYRLSLTE